MSSKHTRGAHVLVIDSKRPWLGLIVIENDKWKHLGGGVESDETPRACAKREVLDEECGLQPNSDLYKTLLSAIEQPDVIYAVKKFDNRLQIFPIRGEPKFTPEAKIESIYFIKRVDTQSLDLNGVKNLRITDYSVDPIVFYHQINGHMIYAMEIVRNAGF